MKVEISPAQRWYQLDVDGVCVWFRGVADVAISVARAAAEGADQLKTALKSAPGHFACIVEGDGFVAACVDNCRTTPVYYSDGVVSNTAEAVRAASGLKEFNGNAIIEFSMSGYVTGRETVYQGLHQLQAGEFLYWRSGDVGCTTANFYAFTPDTLVGTSADELAAITGAAFDRVMRRVVLQVDGRPVWVPLSGGLDSRLILCKLVELGCPNVQAFSYGPPHNDEAEAAKGVAEALGVPWHFMASHKGDMRRFFHSKARHNFWNFANGYNSVPNFQDLLPLMQMMDKGLVHKGDVVINGQSGDYITGGHVPVKLLAEGMGLDDLFDAIVNKHFSLWATLKTEENLGLIRGRVFADLGLTGDETLSPQELSAAYEFFEYKERQCKHVVNGQRVYDFLELDWHLPLWDPEFVEPWRNVPASTKAGQAIYKHYLAAYDYKGLFSSFVPCMDGWPGLSKAVLPFARLIRLVLGSEWRDRYLKAMVAFGMYGYLYAPYPLLKTIRVSQNMRNPFSLYVSTWLNEQGLPAPQGLP